MSHDATTTSATSNRRWYQRLGPGLITACVVIGPGSIMTSSNVGGRYGYGLSWVVVVAVVFMLVYMSLGARLGVSTLQSPGTLIAGKVGRWFAILIGVSVFFISAAFQFGNNLGVHYALATYIDFKYLIVIFNVLAIAFLLSFKNLYRALEKLMMLLVGVMLVAFACNLAISGPRFGEWLAGFVPSRAIGLDISVLGLVGTTFVTTAAFYQAYLVRQKGWSRDELSVGMIDVRVGAFIMAAITLVLMATSATIFYPDFRIEQVVMESSDPELPADRTLIIDDSDPASFEEARNRAQEEIDWETGEPRWAVVLPVSKFEEKYPQDDDRPKTKPRGFSGLTEIGTALRPLFGAIGPTLFFLGVFAAAYSSFLVNSMIGGFILADALGVGEKTEDKWPKIFTITVLLTGMGVALFVIETGVRPVPAIVAAQAVTVIASPLMAGTLLWLTNRKDIMGENRNGLMINILAGVGFLMLLAMGWYVASAKVWPAIQGWLNSAPA